MSSSKKHKLISFATHNDYSPLNGESFKTNQISEPLLQSPSNYREFEATTGAGLTLTTTNRYPQKDFQNHEQEEEFNTAATSCGQKLVKFIFTAVLFLLVLGTSTLSKVCFAAIAGRLSKINLNANATITKATSEQSVAFVQIVLILCIPQIITILKTFFLGILGKTNKHFPWPNKKALIKGIFVAILEAIALSAFTILVASQADPGITILLIPGIFAFTALYGLRCNRYTASNTGNNTPDSQNQQLERSGSNNGCYPCRFNFCRQLLDRKPVKLLALLLQCAGLFGATACIIGMVVTATTDKGKYPSHQLIVMVIGIPMCGMVLSFLWSAMVQKAIFRSGDEYSAAQISADDGGGSAAFPGSYKGGFIYAFIRLVMIPPLCYGMIWAAGIEVDLAAGFHWVGRYDGALFSVQVCGAILTYFFSLLGLWSTFQCFTFTLPLLFSTLVAFAWFWLVQTSGREVFPFVGGSQHILGQNIAIGTYSSPTDISLFTSISLALLWISQLLALGYDIWKKPRIPVARENTLFLSPYFDGIFLDSFLLLNRTSGVLAYRKTRLQESVAKKSKNSTVFICSTMYREAEHEMSQMLKSICSVASNIESNFVANTQDNLQSQFESHIFFDGAVLGDELQEFALQLSSLLSENLGIEVGGVRKWKTPYGYQLHWKVHKHLPFFIHLKDNSKVKNKKRWSQVMYMNYVIKNRLRRIECEGRRPDPYNAFILTTDADIDFKAESVEALLDFLARDDTVGAVCARTHPLGSGPLVWYQKFEYAFGHWFQKSAEHVLGCVLCCPGCFSVFRVKALQDVVKTYESHVTSASEFLTKDMGEDRWLCTLLIQKGWRLEYAALPENSTYCPDNFNEFFNQRRRWVPSTVANLIELVTRAKEVTKSNDSINFLFIIYQVIIIFSTAISPATVILVMASGLNTTLLDIDGNVSIAILSTISLIYVLICLFTEEKIQLTVGKVLTFIMAIIMAVSFVGIAVDSIDNVYRMAAFPLNSTENPLSEGVPLDALYLWAFAVLVILAGLMHFNEFGVLFHFIWYILGLPAGYLLLIIYSACNLHNRSWGTRVGITKSSDNQPKLGSVLKSWYSTIKFQCGRCCRLKKDDTSQPTMPEVDPNEVESAKPTLKYTADVTQPKMDDEVKVWLQELECEDYIENFEKHGYTKKVFIKNLKRQDLIDIGVDRRGYQLRLEQAIKREPVSWKARSVHANVPQFLNSLELGQYETLFRRAGYFMSNDIENLIGLDEAELKRMGISKKAHLQQFLLGLEKMRKPTLREKRIRETKSKLDQALVTEAVTPEENETEFWKKMVKGVLCPESTLLDGNTEELKGNLKELRNKTVITLVFINLMWICMLVLIQHTVLQASLRIQEAPFSALFLAIYFVVILIQFVALVIHRLETFLHILARTNMPGRVRGNWFNLTVVQTRPRLNT